MANEAKRWWVVWDGEYSDEGSVHVKAETEEEAQSLGAEALDLEESDAWAMACMPVTDEQHAEWMKNVDGVKP